MSWLRDNKFAAGASGALVLAIVAYLAIGVFGVHTKFIDDSVDESVPVFDSGAASDIPSDVVDQEMTDDMNEFMADEETPSVVEADEEMPEVVEVAVEESSEPEIFTVAEGTFVPRSHPGSGDAKIITDGSDQRFLRFENFETDNGPDLFVYLTTASADADASAFGVDGEFINLGRLKGNVGDQNYEIPVDADVSQFATVVVWCDRFSVAFTAADLA